MEQAIIQEITEDMLHTYPLFMHLQMVDTNLMCISLLLNIFFIPVPFIDDTASTSRVSIINHQERSA